MGSLATGFVLLPWLGSLACFFVMSAANVVLAGITVASQSSLKRDRARIRQVVLAAAVVTVGYGTLGSQYLRRALSAYTGAAVLEFAERDGSQPTEKVVLAELLSLRSVLLSVVFQMSKGQSVSEEEMRRLIERADREKHKKAMALLDESGRDGEQR